MISESRNFFGKANNLLGSVKEVQPNYRQSIHGSERQERVEI